MTDYASQGRTRPDNVVDLNSCRTHQSYYTCLSRSATADGTIIVQSFDPKLITGGASGYLRQEFRELEILDEITQLRYDNALPDRITGDRRNIVIFVNFSSGKVLLMSLRMSIGLLDGANKILWTCYRS